MIFRIIWNTSKEGALGDGVAGSGRSRVHVLTVKEGTSRTCWHERVQHDLPQHYICEIEIFWKNSNILKIINTKSLTLGSMDS
jgi:hypothetical protein